MNKDRPAHEKEIGSVAAHHSGLSTLVVFSYMSAQHTADMKKTQDFILFPQMSWTMKRRR